MIRENTAPKKLDQIIGKAIFPICRTSGSEEKICIKGFGKNAKHTNPTAINEREISIESFVLKILTSGGKQDERKNKLWKLGT